MITILSFLARVSIISGLAWIIFAGISDLLLNTPYLDRMDAIIDLGSPRVKMILVLAAIAYLIIFILSFINKMTKYSQNRKVKNKSGEIEVTVKTINEVAKDFLVSQDIIKNSKVKSYPSGRGVVVEAVVDTYNVDNLNEKLSKIQEEISECIFKVTGITVKKSKVKLKKVAGETIIEKKIIKEPDTSSLILNNDTVTAEETASVPPLEVLSDTDKNKIIEEENSSMEKSEGEN